MRPAPAEPRPSSHHRWCPRFSVSDGGSPWRIVLRPKLRWLIPVLALSFARMSAAAEWPAPQTTPIDALSQSKFWPSDPDYAFGTSESSEMGKPGQWWLYSFVPDRAPTAPLLRQPGLAAGLSVDAAWRYSIGKPGIVLAFLDDGIDWATDELSRKIVFNPGELGGKPPAHRDQTPCAPLVPNDPDSPRFDCSNPPDGVVTIDDFAEVLGWYPDGRRIDPNGNGILDPGDVVLWCQDHRDDDQNGLVDDIAGWNFVEGNAFPRHLATHSGTDVALDALAKTDNGVGRAGVCPDCLGIPIQVSDQRGTDPQLLALSILYAASRGATAALVGHLPLGRTETLERAVQNAAQRGMLVVLPQDGEQLSHASFSFDFDTWLPIGGLTTRGDNNSTTRTTSFVALDPCQSFAPGVNWVGSGPSCSRRAPSVVLGVAGLVASCAQFAVGPTKLTPSELASTLKGTADPIDTSLTNPGDSSTVRPPSIRRVNANAAVEAVRVGLAPPELGLERPQWYEPVVLDRLTSPLPIVGRMSAIRADSVDLSVSVAVGSKPSDTEFETLFAHKGMDSKTPAQEGSTLATIDLRTWYESIHSTPGSVSETGAVATIRIVATAHYTKLERTTTAEVERRIVLLQDKDLLFGAPFRIGSKPTAPKVADVDGDGVGDIVFGTMDGRLMVLSVRDGRLVDIPPRPIQTELTREFASLMTVPPARSILQGTPAFPSNLGHAAIPAAPAIADLDADRQPEIVMATLDGHLYAIHWDGSSLAGWWPPIQLPGVTPHCPNPEDATDCIDVSPRLERGISSSPVVADVNGDGQLDIVVAAHDGQVHAYASDGTPLAGWPILIGAGPNTRPGRLTQSPAVGDFDGNLAMDLLVTAGEERSKDFWRATHTLVLGSESPSPPRIAEGWPIGVDTSDEILVDVRDRSTPGASIDNSAQLGRALLYGNSSQPFFLALVPGATQESDPLEHGGQLPASAEPVSPIDGAFGFSLTDRGVQSTASDAAFFLPMLARPSIGDLDRDGTADVVLPGITLPSLYALRDNSYLEHQALLGMFSGATGRMLPASPVSLDDFIGSTAAVIADITNDGYPEVIVPNGGDGILAQDACGRSAPGWPKVIGSSISNSLAVGDINNDNLLEVVATTDDGWLYVWQTEGASNSYVPWASALNDAANQSNYRNSEISSVPAYPGPLPLMSSGRCLLPNPMPPKAPTLPQLSARGGCSCTLAPHRESAASVTALLAAMFAGLVRRRRRCTLVPKDGLEPSTPRL
jgi:hypothetical protein